MRKFYLLLFSIFFSLIICEIILHSLVKPSTYYYGYIFDIDLPPKIILPLDQIIGSEEAELERNNWYNRLVVNRKKITKGDLWGIFREDELLSFTSKENAATTNKWWQSNNLGARSTESTPPQKLPSKERILIFGDSYAQSSRVPQDETVDFFLNQLNPDVEVLNFGVDGYGMAQSYLRFQTLKNKVEFDRVILFFVPKADLERDINVHRFIGFNWLSSHAIKIQPRYISKDGELTLIPSPYKNLDELVEENRDSISNKMKNHLRKYDSFYFKFWYETIPIFDNSILVKLLKHIIYEKRIESLKENLMSPDSEALQVSKKIIDNMNQDVKNEGGQLTVVVLPTIWDIYDYWWIPEFKQKWKNMVSYVCSEEIDCVDLMVDFKKIPTDRLDTGYDQTHYGPETNRFIAELINQSGLN